MLLPRAARRLGWHSLRLAEGGTGCLLLLRQRPGGLRCAGRAQATADDVGGMSDLGGDPLTGPTPPNDERRAPRRPDTRKAPHRGVAAAEGDDRTGSQPAHITGLLVSWFVVVE